MEEALSSSVSSAAEGEEEVNEGEACVTVVIIRKTLFGSTLSTDQTTTVLKTGDDSIADHFVKISA